MHIERVTADAGGCCSSLISWHCKHVRVRLCTADEQATPTFWALCAVGWLTSNWDAQWLLDFDLPLGYTSCSVRGCHADAQSY